MKVKTADFAQEVEFVLDSYGDEVKHSVHDAVKSVAQRCLKRIKAKSPRLTGDYEKGWRIKTQSNGWMKLPTYVIHNETKYQLIHLLEFGHAKSNGGRTPAFPHVRPAADAAEKELVDAVASALENEAV